MTVKPFRSVSSAAVVNHRVSNKEYRRAAYDIISEMLLEGYEESTGLPVKRETGLVLVLFWCFIFTFDYEFERQWPDGRPLDYAALLRIPSVADVWDAMAEYLDVTGDTWVIPYLLETFRAFYPEYCQSNIAARADGGFGAAMRLARLDSGRALEVMYQMIRLYNGHEQHSGCAAEFFGVGMAGKFLDDLRDLADDVRNGSPNLLFALTSEHQQEKFVLAQALRGDARFSLYWWSRNCPESIAAYFEQTFGYFDKVRAPRLRLSLNGMLVMLATRRYWRKPRASAR